MTLAYENELLDPKTVYENREQLVLSNLPLEGAITYKRMVIYSAIKIVELNPNISESNIIYNLQRIFDYDPKLVKSALASLSSKRVFPVLRWWKNTRMRRSNERFFTLNQETDQLREKYVNYLETNFPELLVLDLTK